MANMGRRMSMQPIAPQEDWEELKNILGENRSNVQAVQHPENAEKFRYLRPMSVGAFAAGVAMSNESDKIMDDNDHVFLKDQKEGFVEATILHREDDGRLFVKNSKGKDLYVYQSECEEVNPKLFDFCENMARLTHLSEASILHNLRLRYRLNLIHTYSGLFCITINPWRWLPLYSDDISLLYKGQANQSILITGESGAGKTENTKKIINYFTTVAHSAGRQSLEQQIIATNPVLEAFGNAKTVYNDNSSRFGKFIRVHFRTSDTKIHGADVESYLLEKSRVISQGPGERSFHIFYMLLSTGFPQESKDLCSLGGAAGDYRFLANGVDTVASIDDEMEMRQLDTSLEMLGFASEERMHIYRSTAAVLLLGQMKFSETSSGQAIIHGMDEAKRVAKLLGIKPHDLVDLLTEPTVKVGDEIIRQSRNFAQVMFSVNAVAKTMYEKLFIYIVKGLNRSIATEQSTLAKFETLLFIGLLDVAGFEIFMLNSFEQLCINYTNEKLQQFFNHRMFVVEQEIYLEEGIPWNMEDFGTSLEGTINLIDKPMGILSLLEEECMMPKGSDKSFIEKVDQQHTGTNAYTKAKPSRKSTHIAHFTIHHYAGQVNYNCDGWIDKNKDPMNECMINLFRESTEPRVAALWTNGDKDRFSEIGVGQMEIVSSAGQGGRKMSTATQLQNTKSMSFMTVSNVYKEQLNNLMHTLEQTEPHFIRCIVPNYEKKPGYIDGPLVLHQLKCNGVLEGIRICRQGYPNRVPFEEFAHRFSILASDEITWNDDPTFATRKILKAKQLKESDDYEIGRTKLFCRAGILGKFERWRTDRINELVITLQAQIRTYLAQMGIVEKLQEIEAQNILRENIRHWSELVNWKWYRLLRMVRPMLSDAIANHEEEMGKLQKTHDTLKEELDSAHTEQESLKRKTSVLQETLEDVQQKKKELANELDALRRKTLEESENDKQEIERLNHELRKREREVQILKDGVDKDAGRMKEFKRKNEDMSATVDQLRSALDRERLAREEMEKSQGRASKDLDELKKTLSDVLTEKKRLEHTVKDVLETRSTHLENQVVDMRDKCDKLMKYIKELEKRIEELNDQLHEERMKRRTVERSRSVLKDEYSNAEDKLVRLEKVFNSQVEQLRDTKNENSRLEKQMKETESTLQAEIEELRRRHKVAVDALQQQVDLMHKKSLKLESDNASMKAQLEHESRLTSYDTTFRSGMQSPRNNSLSRVARSSSQMVDKGLGHISNGRSGSISCDFPTPPMKSYYSPEYTQSMHRKSLEEELMKRAEDLQKHVRELENEKRLMKRNIDVYKQTLEDDTHEKDQLEKQIKVVQYEMDRVKEQLKLEEYKSYEQQHQLLKLNSELTMWRTKFEEQLVEKDSELDYERQRLLEKLKSASEDTETASSRVTQMGHYHAELQAELAETQKQLNRACRTIANQENIQRTQEKTYEHLIEQYEALAVDVEAVRVENSDLKLKIHQTEKRRATEYAMSDDEKGAELEKRLDQVMNENAALSQELQRMRESSIQLIDNFNQELHNVKEQLQQQNENKEPEVDPEALKTTERLVDELKTDNESKQRTVQLLQTELELTKEAVESKDKAIKELKSASQQFQVTRGELQEQAQAHAKNAAELADQLHRLQKENLRLEEKLLHESKDNHNNNVISDSDDEHMTPHKTIPNGVDQKLVNGDAKETVFSNGFDENGSECHITEETLRNNTNGINGIHNSD